MLETSHHKTDNLFRKEYANLVASITRLLGHSHVDIAEDLAQETILAALHQWRFTLPNDPTAWLYRVAKNKVVDFFRTKKSYTDVAALPESESLFVTELESAFTADALKDSQLQMMFSCCHPLITPESQITLILKTICGLSTAEIARVFLTHNDTVSKRLFRAKKQFRKLGKDRVLAGDSSAVKSRLEVVLKSIYLLFTEAYFSFHDDQTIRKELCFDALYLCKLLADNPATAFPETFAFMALLCFHISRFQSRIVDGALVLLKDQDRSKWDRTLIERGSFYLDKSMAGAALSSYHLEAMIAAQYSLAPSHEAINWHDILVFYEKLEQLNPSPMVHIYKAVPLDKLYGAEKALAHLDRLSQTEHLIFFILKGELLAKMKDWRQSRQHFERAREMTKSAIVLKFIDDKIAEMAW